MAEQQRAIAKILEGIDENLTREDLLDRITAIEGEHTEQILNVLISMARPLVDYQFFQLLTQRIEETQAQGDQASVDRLTEIRAMILDLAQRLDAEVRERMQEKAHLLTEIIQSPDPQSTIRARMEEIDSVFFSVLEANLAQSEQQHQHQVADRLREIQNMIAQVLQESAPPEIRFINRLLQADYPDETRQILMDNKAMIDAELLSIFDVLGQDLEQRGDTQTSEQLKKIKAQAEILAV
jgi:transcriptional regulator with XRE-family HTH domain